MPDTAVRFSLDAGDHLIEVNDGWDEFARANGAPSLTAEHIIGQSVWSQIADETTRAVYRIILNRARQGHPVRLDYRCDSPGYRRTFVMEVTSPDQARVDLVSTLLGEEERKWVPLLDTKLPRDTRRVRLCSWCQRMSVPHARWITVEEAEAMIQPIDGAVPELTHGICPECADLVIASLTKG